MGQQITTASFTDEEFECFRARLLDNLQSLKQLLQRPGFGVAPPSIGAELEMYLVDRQARPLSINKTILERSGDPQLALELNQFNLEYNLTPVLAAGRPFSLLEQEMQLSMAHLNELLLPEQGYVLPIGILPTLKRSDFGLHAMTDEQRFSALSRALADKRGSLFCIQIEGDEPLSLRARDVTLEGANTSFQLHFRVTPAQFADLFNALQLVTPLMVALAANSPFMLEHKLWHETRIPLFQQAIDGRSAEECQRAVPSRVDFGSGWVREGAYELFAEMVHLHAPLLPVSSEENSLAVAAAGGLPALDELRLHAGTVWPWNRVVYDPAQGGHLRVEIRSLPAGPSAIDMAANAAMYIGLAVGLQSQINEYIPALPFGTLRSNFEAAGQKGLTAELMWPHPQQSQGLLKQPVTDIARSLLPVAKQGLVQLGVENSEIDSYLSVIESRLDQGINGAIWQRREYHRLCRKLQPHAALVQMVQHYRQHLEENRPVAQWR
ncbi:hypothetical protein ACFVYJ_02910 [Pontibacter sp. JAM-7]|uniref:hypothetical protein n=1 Tax=Pontibacter sp. JAM-7 TaxID=3366581 RepID=UPI003AF92CD1